MTDIKILEEIESLIDINKEEEAIENFLRENMPSGHGYCIYKLKTKALHKKFETIIEEYKIQAR